MRPSWSNGENTECGGSILQGLSASTMPDSEAPLLPPAPVPALHLTVRVSWAAKESLTCGALGRRSSPTAFLAVRHLAGTSQGFSFLACKWEEEC